MRVFVRLRAAALCSLLLFMVIPALAFDEDHHEVINGATLHFRVRGADKANPYVVILHGGPGFSAHMFYGWGPSLEKSLNVVYLDQRGCGESARLSVANLMAPQPSEIKGYTFSTLIADVEGVRQLLKVDKWYVLGHSYGGMLGLEYAAAHPDHVLGLIDMDGPVSVPQMQNAILASAAKKFTSAKDDADLATAKQLQALPPDSPARMFGAFGLAMGPAGLYFAGDQKSAFAAFYGQIGQALRPYPVPPAALMPATEPGAALIANDHFLTRDDTPLLAQITVPTLIINGKQDGVITPQSAEASHAAIKNSQLVEIDHCGHFPFFEQPKKTTAAILHFTQPHPIGSHDVVIDFVVDTQGHPTQIRVVHSCGDREIDQKCVDAVSETKFQPAIVDGVPHSAPAEREFHILQ